MNRLLCTLLTATMQNISSILAQVKMTEQGTLAVKSRYNCVYRLLTVFQCLLLFPCFGIKNAYRNQKYGILDSLIKARKDVFYRFMENPDINWRKALWHISVQLWNRIHLRSDHKADEVCLILDDTDHEKTGRNISSTTNLTTTSRKPTAASGIAKKTSPGTSSASATISNARWATLPATSTTKPSDATCSCTTTRWAQTATCSALSDPFPPSLPIRAFPKGKALF